MFSKDSGRLIFATMADGGRRLVPNAEPADIYPGGDFVVHPSINKTGQWSVTETLTGRRVGIGIDSQDAIDHARLRISAHIACGGSLAGYLEKLHARPFIALAA